MKEYINMPNLNIELKANLESLVQEFIFNKDFDKSLEDKLHLLFNSDDSGDIHSDKNKLVAYIEANWTTFEKELTKHNQPIKIQIMSSPDTMSHDEKLQAEINKIKESHNENLQFEIIYHGPLIAVDDNKLIINQLTYDWELDIDPVTINILRKIEDLETIVDNIINIEEIQALKELEILGNKISELQIEMDKLVQQRTSLESKISTTNKPKI
jgi:hypothetical protein